MHRETEALTVGRLTLDPNDNTLVVRDVRVQLTGAERRVMAALIRARGERVGFDRLYAAVWGEPEDGGPENPSECLRIIVHKIRCKTLAAGILRAILTARSDRGAHDVGYRLNPETFA